MEREISPPPSKRRKTSQQQAATDPSTLSGPTAAQDAKGNSQQNDASSTIRIFSWNINGVAPFIPASRAPITAYFKPTKQISSAAPATSPSASLRAFLFRHDWPHVLFLQELKIAPSDTRTSAALLTAVNTPLGSHDKLSPCTTYTLHTVLPQDRRNAGSFGGKIYGVGTLLRQDFSSSHVSLVRTVPWDQEGRVSIVETKDFASPPTTPSTTQQQEGDSTTTTTPPHRLALLNIYAVNGTPAPYRDPATGAAAGTRHDRKLAFHARLLAECLALEARGFAVLVAGDLNVARDARDGHPRLRTVPAQHCANRADFNAKFFGSDQVVGDDHRRAQDKRGHAENDDARPGNGGGGGGGRGGGGSGPGAVASSGSGGCLRGVDVWRALRGRDERRYTYFPRGRDWGTACDRVDLAIASRALWERGAVTDAGILDSPQERGPSDHVPIWVEVRTGAGAMGAGRAAGE